MTDVSESPPAAECVIRAAHSSSERRAALAMLAAEWPGEADWFWLGLSDPRFRPEQFLVAVAGGTVVGHVQVAGPRRMQYGRAWLTVGGLHGLVVAPAWRGRGIGRRLVAAAHRLLQQLGAAVSIVLAPHPGYYIPLGYAPVLPLYSAVIPAEAAARADAPLSVRACQPDDVPIVANAHAAALVPHGIGTFRRTHEDWRWLLETLAQTDRSRLRPFFGRERQLLVPVGPEAAPGYIWSAVDDSRLWLFEAACQPREATRWLATAGARAVIRGQREVVAIAPPDHPLAAAIYAHGGSHIRRQGSGLACIIDFGRLLAEAAPELQARLGAEPSHAMPGDRPLTVALLAHGLVEAATAALPPEAAASVPVPGATSPAAFAAPPDVWARLVFGQMNAADPYALSSPPLLRLLFPPATPHIWPVDNRF